MKLKIIYCVVCISIVVRLSGMYGHGMVPFSNGLHEAAAQGNIKQIDKIVNEKKADVNAHLPYGNAPLGKALELRQWRAAEHLIVQHKATIFPRSLRDMLFSAKFSRRRCVDLPFLDRFLAYADNKKELFEFENFSPVTDCLPEYSLAWQVDILKVLLCHGLAGDAVKKVIAQESEKKENFPLHWIGKLLGQFDEQRKVYDDVTQAARVVADDFQQLDHVSCTPSHVTEWPCKKDIQELCLAYEKCHAKLSTSFLQKYSFHPQSLADVALVCQHNK